MNNRAPELPSALQCATADFETLKNRALHRLCEEANTITELAHLVRNLKGIREPDKWGEHYSLDEWVRLINTSRYKEARLWLLSHQA